MSVASRIPLRAIDDMLDALFGRDVRVSGATEMDLYVPSLRGLVTEDDELVGAIGGDRGFVATAGAALALQPAVTPGTEDDEAHQALIEFYEEVVAVLSRLVNDFGAESVRIEPAVNHPSEDLGLVVGAAERCLFALDIEGYGQGTAGIWTCL